MHPPAPRRPAGAPPSRALAALLAALLACWPLSGGAVCAQAVADTIAVQPGAELRSFVPWHVSGPNRDHAACPLCVHGQRPGLALWLRPAALAASVPVVQAIDAALAGLRPHDAVGYAVLVPDAATPRDVSAQALRDTFARAALQRVFLTIADADDADLAHYRVAPQGSISLLGYVNRTAAWVWHQPDQRRLADLGRALRELMQAHEPYAESAVWLCDKDEPGERLELFGRVRDEHGQPLARASVIAYATDASGRYVPVGAPAEQRTPRLRAVAITDADGFYRFATVRPGPYPHSDDPAHVHLHIDAAVHAHTYRTVWFEGDPRITPHKRASLDRETQIVPLRRRADGVWSCRLDVQLAGS